MNHVKVWPKRGLKATIVILVTIVLVKVASISLARGYPSVYVPIVSRPACQVALGDISVNGEVVSWTITNDAAFEPALMREFRLVFQGGGQAGPIRMDGVAVWYGAQTSPLIVGIGDWFGDADMRYTPAQGQAVLSVEITGAMAGGYELELGMGECPGLSGAW